MSTRQWILRTLLATLGIAAVGGAIGILFGGDDLTWRIVGSAITVSMGCMFFQACNGMSRVDNFHHAGLLGMVITCIEFVLTLLLIWMVDSNLFGNDNFWEVCGMIALTLPLTGGLAMLGLYLKHKDSFKLAALKLLAITTITQITFTLAAINTAYRLRSILGNDDHLWRTGWVTLVFGLIASIILAGGFRWHKLVGLISALIAWIMLVADIWIMDGDDPTFFALFCIVSIAYAHGNVIWHLNIKPGAQAMTRLFVQVLAILTGCLMQLAVMEIISKNARNDLARLVGSCAFMLVCSTFALLVMHAANRRRSHRRTVEESELVYNELSLTCPHCQLQQTLPVGESQCSQCNMQFQIKLFEPHCPHCDYLLVNSTSDTCPECGKAVKLTHEKPA